MIEINAQTAVIICLIIGVICFLLGIKSLISRIESVKSFRKVAGKIVEINKSYASDSTNYLYSPVVEFTTDFSEKIVFESSVSTSFTSYKIGDKVNICYNPADPKNAYIDSFIYKWGTPIILFIIGIFFVVTYMFFSLFDIVKNFMG